MCGEAAHGWVTLADLASSERDMDVPSATRAVVVV